jgi:Dolichyl-phosphate-mannose-protein mannosyltransferase
MSASVDKVSVGHPLWSGWGSVALLFLVAGVFVSACKLTNPYSYWLDELYSVTASHENMASLNQILLNDVHPPLYQLLLKGWMFVFGEGEVATRSLSWFFAVASLYPVWKCASRYGVAFFVCSLAVFSTNMLFTSYANESRSYAMVLFLATLVSTLYVAEVHKRISPVFLLVCVALSLTHYFGLIFVGVMLGLQLIERRADRGSILKILGTGVVAGLWPLYHALSGTLLNKSGGNFSGQVHGVLDSLGIAASGFMPRFERFGAYFLIGGIVGAMGVLYSGRGRSATSARDLYQITFRLALVLSCFLCLVAFIDLFSPMSSRKYYIVMLPLVALVIAGVVQIISQHSPKLKHLLLVVVCVYSALALKTSFNEVTHRANPDENWKEASQFIVKTFRGEHVYFTTEDYHVWSENDVDRSWREKIATFYLRKDSGGRFFAVPYVIGETSLQRPALILWGHNPLSMEKLSEEMKKFDAIRVFPFPGFSGGWGVGVYRLK